MQEDAEIYYSAPEYCDDRVCLCGCVCVCLSVRDHIFGTARPIFTKLFAHVTYGRGSVLLWQRSDALCTSGFVDDVMFAHKPRLLDVATPGEAQCTRSLGPGYKLHSGSNTSCGPDDAWDYFSQLD